MRPMRFLPLLAIAFPIAAEEPPPSWAEIREGRARAVAKIETLYMRYGQRHVTLEKDKGDTWLVDVTMVVELWMDGATIRQRTHQVTRARLNPQPDGSSEPYSAGEFQHHELPGVSSARTPESVAFRDELHAPPMAYMSWGTGRGYPPRPTVLRGDKARAFGENLAKENIVAAAFDYHLPDESDIDTDVFAQRREGWPNYELERRDGMLLKTLRDPEPKPRLRHYQFIDPNRGYLSIAEEGGRINFNRVPQDGREHYNSAHTIPFEPAPGIWLPRERAGRYLETGRRSVSKSLVIECRVNEPIDPAVFDPASVGLGEFAGPEGSPIPGERRYTVPVVTFEEVTGEAERLARRDGGQPTILAYPIRLDDGLPPPFPPPPAPEPSEPAQSSVPFDTDAALRWLVVIATAAILVIVIANRLRSA